MQDKPLIDALKAFRSMGFFADRNGMSDMDLAVQLGYDVTQQPGRWSVRDDIMLLANDQDRVWWEDSAAGVAAGAGVYTKTLQDWAGISRGALTIDTAEEFWGSADGPVWIKVEINGGAVSDRLRPDVIDGGRLDFSILRDLNRAIKSSDMEFCLLAPMDTMAFLVVLTPEERRKLIKGRGWKLASPRNFYQSR